MVLDLKLSKESIWNTLSEIMDPEIPNISVVELGMIKQVDISPQGYIVIVTPTFSGCPAKEVIVQEIKTKLKKTGVSPLFLHIQLTPPWSVKDIKPSCFSKLRQVGIAPPVAENELIKCPRCNSDKVKILSFFGATSCKSQLSCLDCLEPFEYFKGNTQFNKKWINYA